MFNCIDIDIARNDKTVLAAQLLGIRVSAMVGHLVLLWSWAMVHAPDGDLSDYPASIIALHSDWGGEAQDFIDALVNCKIKRGGSGFLERSGETILIHDWDEFGGRLHAARAKNAARMREARGEKPSIVQNSCDARALHPLRVLEESREEKRREEKSLFVPAAEPDGNAAPPTNGAGAKKIRRSRPGDLPAYDPDGFVAFYTAYPRHDDRSDAIRAWDQIKPSPEERAAIMACLTPFRLAPSAEQKKHCKLPAGWLRELRWQNDDPFPGLRFSEAPVQDRAAGNCVTRSIANGHSNALDRARQIASELRGSP